MAQFNDMLAQIGAMLSKKENEPFSYEELASMLKTSPDVLKTFEDVYKTQVLESSTLSDNLLQWDTATVKAMLDKSVPFTKELDNLIGVRTRAISRKLRGVQSLDEASAATLLELDTEPGRPVTARLPGDHEEDAR